MPGEEKAVAHHACQAFLQAAVSGYIVLRFVFTQRQFIHPYTGFTHGVLTKAVKFSKEHGF